MKLSRGLSLLSLLPFALAAPPSSASLGNSASNGHISMGWFADWHDNFTVSNINWGGYNAMAFFTSVISLVLVLLSPHYISTQCSTRQ